nr:MAG TPA: hypothetical protein [Caudoviricetes sp.]
MKDMERFTEEAKMKAMDAWNRFAEALADLGRTAEEAAETAARNFNDIARRLKNK